VPALVLDGGFVLSEQTPIQMYVSQLRGAQARARARAARAQCLPARSSRAPGARLLSFSSSLCHRAA
jgi:glutathione S-transferase